MKLYVCFLLCLLARASERTCHWIEAPSTGRFQKIHDWLAARPHLAWLGVCDNGHSRTAVTRRDWEWSCAPPELPFSPEVFCANLDRLGGGLLFIGDSLSRLHAVTLAAMLNGTETVSWKFSGDVISDKRQDRWDICEQRLKLGFVRNDLLAVTSADCKACNAIRSGRRRSHICEPWANSALLKDFSVFVLNSGAHTVNESWYESNIRNAAKYLVVEAPHSSLLLYRDTVPGHGGCEAHFHDDPLRNVSGAEAYVKGHPWYDGGGTSQTFKRRNELANQVFGGSGVQHRPTYGPTLMRLDSHISARDCLHYCVPGPSIVRCEMLHRQMPQAKAMN